MDNGVLKPIAPAAAVPIVRPHDKTTFFTKTDLPDGNAVPPVEETQRPRPAGGEVANRHDAGADALERRHYRDAITKDVVYRATNPENGEVVVQIPDESLLRLRRFYAAYDQLAQQPQLDRRA